MKIVLALFALAAASLRLSPLLGQNAAQNQPSPVVESHPKSSAAPEGASRETTVPGPFWHVKIAEPLPTDSERDRAGRDTLRQKMAEEERAAAIAAGPVSPPSAAPAPVQTPAYRFRVRETESAKTTGENLKPVETAAQVQAPQAELKKEASDEKTKATAIPQQKSSAAPPPGPKKNLVKKAPAAPKASPAAPEPPPRTKEQRLSDLLQAYKSDLITPVEYHRQRAKLLAEP